MIRPPASPFPDFPRERILSPESTDKDVTCALKEFLFGTLEALRKTTVEPVAPGDDPCAAWRAAIDATLSAIHTRSRRKVIGDTTGAGHQLALVAVGGYGRGEMCPRSDIDILFLHANKVDRYVESMTESILYALWDQGLDVGHAVRNSAEAIRYAASDDTIRTALLDHRFLAGDSPFYREACVEIDKFLLYSGADRFIETKIEEMRKRRAKQGGTVFVLEPNMKEGVGGLRDLQTALWAARIKYKSASLVDLRNKGVLSAQSVRALSHVHSWLLRVRTGMHILAGKKTDVLSFEMQDQLAVHFRYRNQGSHLGVERFMRAYYLNAASAASLADEVVDAVTRHISDDPGHRTFAGIFSRRKSMSGEAILYKGTLTVKNPEAFRKDPVKMLEFFRAMQESRGTMSPQARKSVLRALSAIGPSMREDRRANRIFLDILGDPLHLRETLLAMNETRFLGRFIPEFAPARAKVLHDIYHVYTLDVHSLRAASEITEVANAQSRTPEEEAFLSIWLAIPRKDLLHLAILLHDVGKGRGGKHAVVGAELCAKIGARMGLSEAEVADLVFLVDQHLTMALVSQRRDLHDIDMILSFAKGVGSVPRLDHLYLLTWADMRAVGPEVWTKWKGTLLAELYGKARNVLEHAPIKRPFEEEARERRRKVRDVLMLLPPEEVDRYLERFGDRYFLSTPDARLADHLRMLRSAGDGSVPVVEIFSSPAESSIEVVVIVKDAKGLFATIAGTLAANGLNIHNATIATSLDGFAVDTFLVTWRGAATLEEGKGTRIISDLARVLTGKADVNGILAQRMGRPTRERTVRYRPTKVVFDNEMSSLFTVVDIFTYDRLGLLYDITRTFTEFDVDIVLSKISTKGDQVADVFYVRGSDGGKIVDPDRLDALREAIFRATGEEAPAVP